MPIITPSLPPQHFVGRLLRSETDPSLAQGPVGILLQENLQNVHRHWQDRTPVVDDDIDLDLIDELNSYVSPKFKIIGKRIVKYVETKPLIPSHIDWDFDDFEDFE